ncbi:MAG: PQQ-binding-like beta-propeller repeat protein [Bdellovibrionales bacterium]|nr:PQQ-binding-like beta-propeller repeat protein [Bdellovibrionales bacterium]
MKQLSILAFLFLLVPAANAELTAFNRWVNLKPTTYRFEHRPSERSHPVIVGDILYYATLNGDIFALHRIQGNVLWHRNIGAPIDGAFSYGRSKLFVGDTRGNLYALEARNGDVVWQKKVSSQWLTPPVQVGSRLFAMTSAHELYAYSERKGEELWQYARHGDEKMTIRGTATPVVFGSEIYQGFADGYMVALSMETGKLRWEKKLRQRARFYDVDTTPYVDAEKLITGTYDGSLYSLDRQTGDIQWRLPVGSYGGVLVENNRLFFSGLDKNVYSVDAVSGKVLWKTPFNKGVGMAPSLVRGGLVVPTSADPLYVLDPETGKILWTERLGTGTTSPASVHQDGWFYCLSNYGQLYAFEMVERPHRDKAWGTLKTLSAIYRENGGTIESTATASGSGT